MSSNSEDKKPGFLTWFVVVFLLFASLYTYAVSSSLNRDLRQNEAGLDMVVYEQVVSMNPDSFRTTNSTYVAKDKVKGTAYIGAKYKHELFVPKEGMMLLPITFKTWFSLTGKLAVFITLIGGSLLVLQIRKYSWKGLKERLGKHKVFRFFFWTSLVVTLVAIVNDLIILGS